MSGDVLSQSEIDALLSALSTGEMDVDELKREQSEKRVKVYDFKRALRFSKDQIRSLTRIYENFSRLLTTHFSAQLRTYVQISVATVDQIPYEEFIRSIPNMTILNVFEVPPLEGRIILEVNPNVAYAMMDRMMGGKGESVNKIENLTEIETKIISSMFERACEYMKEAWETIIDMEPVLAEFEINPQFLQMVSPNETVIVISLNTTIGDTQGMINICIPYVVLEPIIPKLSVHYWMQNEMVKRSPEESERIKNQIEQALLPVSVELGTATITVEDFLLLDIGDVFVLNQSIEKPLLVKVGEIPKFIGQPGKINKKLAVQILDRWNERGGLDE